MKLTRLCSHTPIAALLPARVGQVLEGLLQTINLERYMAAGFSASAMTAFITVLCVSTCIIPWMMRSRDIFWHRDVVLLLDVSTDAFYGWIFPSGVAIAAGLKRVSIASPAAEHYAGGAELTAALTECLVASDYLRLGNMLFPLFSLHFHLKDIIQVSFVVSPSLSPSPSTLAVALRKLILSL